MLFATKMLRDFIIMIIMIARHVQPFNFACDLHVARKLRDKLHSTCLEAWLGLKQQRGMKYVQTRKLLTDVFNADCRHKFFKHGGIMKRKSCESAENHCEKPAKMTRSTEKDKKYDRQLR